MHVRPNQGVRVWRARGERKGLYYGLMRRTMSEALTMATKDADLKEAFFTTPIALKAAGALEQQPIKYHKGDYKEDYKGPYVKGSGKMGQKGKKGGGKGQMPVGP